jgi:hypothetical protein
MRVLLFTVGLEALLCVTFVIDPSTQNNSGFGIGIQFGNGNQKPKMVFPYTENRKQDVRMYLLCLINLLRQLWRHVVSGV